MARRWVRDATWRQSVHLRGNPLGKVGRDNALEFGAIREFNEECCVAGRRLMTNVGTAPKESPSLHLCNGVLLHGEEAYQFHGLVDPQPQHAFRTPPKRNSS